MKTITSKKGLKSMSWIFKSLLILVMSLSYFGGHSQIVLDGDQCAGEYGPPDVVDGDEGFSSSSEVLDFWASLQRDAGETYIYFAFEREGTGAAGFSFYLDTDCDATNGDQTAGREGSDYSAFFGVKKTGDISPITLFEWTGSGYSDTGSTFEPAIGSTNATTCDANVILLIMVLF